MRELNSNEIEHVSGGSAEYSPIPWILDGSSSDQLTLGLVTVTGEGAEAQAILAPWVGGIIGGGIVGGIGGFAFSLYEELTDGVPGVDTRELFHDTVLGLSAGLIAGSFGTLGSMLAANQGIGAGGQALAGAVSGGLSGVFWGAMGDWADDLTDFGSVPYDPEVDHGT